MILTDFEPGDGTRYIVGFEALMQSQAQAMGHGQDPAALFIFGHFDDLHCFTFATEGPHLLHIDYYAQKMRLVSNSHNQWTICAGMHAFAALTGRTIVCPLSDTAMEWEPGWQGRLGARHTYPYEYLST